MNRYKILMTPWGSAAKEGKTYCYGVTDAAGEPVDRKFFDDPANRVIFVRGGKQLLRTPGVVETQAWKFFNQFSWGGSIRSDNLSVKPVGEFRKYVEITGREQIETSKTKSKYVNGRYEYTTHNYKTTVNRYKLNWAGQRKYDELRKEQKPDLTEAQRKLDHEIKLAEFEATKFYGAYHNWCVERDLSKLEGHLLSPYVDAATLNGLLVPSPVFQ